MGPSLSVTRIEGGKTVLAEVRELSDQEYERYKNAAKRLIKWQGDEQPYAAVVNGYRQLITSLNMLSQRHARGERLNGLQVRNHLNERVSNFLHAWRAFLDQSSRTLSSHYGSESEQLKRFEESCSREYDSSFSYRFMDQLRNYSQHAGRPVGHVSLTSSIGEFGDPSIDSYRLEVNVDRDSLLEWRSLKSAVRKEVEGLPARIPLEPHVNALMQSIYRIHGAVVAQQIPDLTESAQRVLEVATPAEQEGGNACIIDLSATLPHLKEPGDTSEFRIEEIPSGLARFILNTMVVP